VRGDLLFESPWQRKVRLPQSNKGRENTPLMNPPKSKKVRENKKIKTTEEEKASLSPRD